VGQNLNNTGNAALCFSGRASKCIPWRDTYIWSKCHTGNTQNVIYDILNKYQSAVRFQNWLNYKTEIPTAKWGNISLIVKLDEDIIVFQRVYIANQRSKARVEWMEFFCLALTALLLGETHIIASWKTFKRAVNSVTVLKEMMLST